MKHFAESLSDRFGSRLLLSETARAHYAQSEGYHRHDPPAAVAQPETIEEVQLLVRQAAAHRLSVVAYGAGTSLEGNAAATQRPGARR